MYTKYKTAVQASLSIVIERINNMLEEAKRENNTKDIEYWNNKDNRIDWLLSSCKSFYVDVPGVSQNKGNISGKYNCPYVYAMTLRELGHIQLSDRLLEKLDAYYDEEMDPWPLNQDDYFQRIFHYPTAVVESRIRAYKDYMNTLKDKSKCVFDDNTIEVIEYIDSFINKYSGNNWETNQRELKVHLEDMKKFPYNLTKLCDNIENTLKRSFARELNDNISHTKDELEEQEGRIKVLDGQDFKLVVHDGSPRIVSDKKENIGFCASLIDQNNTITYKYHHTYQFAYFDIEENDISCATSNDSMTSNDRETFSNNSDFEFIDIDTFQKRTLYDSTYGYNEINFAYTTQVKPYAIVCYDEVTPEDLSFAEEFNLNIILIKTECYPNMVKSNGERQNIQRIAK